MSSSRVSANLTLRRRALTAAFGAFVYLPSGSALAQPAAEEDAAEGAEEPPPAAEAAAPEPAAPAPAAPAAAPTPAPAAEPAAKEAADAPKEKAGWSLTFYGTAALNVIHDSTQ